MNTSEQTSASKREQGFYFVSWHHSTDWFPAQWTGSWWAVNDEDGESDYFDDNAFDFIDERRIERPTPQQQPDTEISKFNPYTSLNHGRKEAWLEGAKWANERAGQPDELSKAQARIRELEELINEAVLCLPIGEPFTAWKNKVREYKTQSHD